MLAGPFTIFAPTNDAFALMDEPERSELLGSVDLIKKLIGRIVLQQKLQSSDIREGLLETFGGETITVSKDDGHNSLTMFNGHSSVIIKKDVQVKKIVLTFTFSILKSKRTKR